MQISIAARKLRSFGLEMLMSMPPMRLTFSTVQLNTSKTMTSCVISRRSLSSAMSREDFLSRKINDGLDSCTFSQDHSSSVFGYFRSLAFRKIPVSSLGCKMYQKQRSLMASCGCSTPDTRQTFRKWAYQSLKPAKS